MSSVSLEYDEDACGIRAGDTDVPRKATSGGECVAGARLVHVGGIGLGFSLTVDTTVIIGWKPVRIKIKLN